MENDNYITKEELCDLLEISNNYSEATYGDVIRKIVKIFGLKRYKKRIDIESKPINVYDKGEVTEIANRVLEFFEKHYPYNIAEEKLGIRPTKFEKVEIPEGYWLIMKTSSGCTQWKLAFKKDEIDTYLDMVAKIEQGYYISRKHTMSYLGMTEKRFNGIKYKFDEIVLNNTYYYNKEEIQAYYKKYIKDIDENLENNKYMTRKELLDFLEITNNYSEVTYNHLISKIHKAFGLKPIDVDCKAIKLYCRDEVTAISNRVLEFFEKHYPYNVAEKKLGVSVNLKKFSKIEIPNGYNLIMKTTTGCNLDKIAFKKDNIDAHLNTKTKIEQGYYISRKDAMSLLGISEGPFNKKVRNKLEEVEFNSVYYYKKEEVKKFKIEYNPRTEKPKIEKRTSEKYIIKMNNVEILITDIPDGFIDKDRTLNLLGMDNGYCKKVSKASIGETLKKIVDGFKIETISIKNRLFYKEDDVIKAIEEVGIFCKNHYSLTEVLQMLSLVSIHIDTVKIPNHYIPIIKYKYKNESIGRLAIKKSDVEYYKNHRMLKADKVFEVTEEHISEHECLEVLNVSRDTFKKIKKEYGIAELMQHSTKKKYCYRSEILELKNKINEFYKEYITSRKAMEKYFNDDYNTFYRCKGYLNTYDTPLFAYTTENAKVISHFKGKVLKISEVEYLRDNLENIIGEKHAKKGINGNYRGKKSYINYNLEGETYLDTFNLRLYERWSGFSDKSPYTRDKWLEFVKVKIESMRSDKKVSINKVNSYIHATRELDNMLKYFKVNEVYELTSNNINTYFNLIPKKNGELFYDFLGRVSKDVESMLKRKGYRKKGFRMEYIHNPANKRKGERKLKAYGFDVYSKLFKYAVDLKRHTEKSINEIIEKKTAIYASTWLYNILHLNNAWRHGDATRFPKLELKDVLTKYGIDDYSWFNENEVSLEISRLVISKVVQWELVISKTEAQGRFFCSDELAPAFACSVLMLFLYHEKNQPVIESTDEDVLMVYTTKYNRPSEKNINDYFKDFTVKGFKFSSLRMNKTVLTLIYYLANLSGDSKALVYAQKIRGHIDENSPLDYVEIDMKEFETLTRHLFVRGEFGYIASLLVSRLISNDEGPVTFEDMTEQIIQVNGLFGELCGLYNTVGFLNNVKHERQLIIDTLAHKSLKDCQMILTDIFTQKLPSRMDNVQCLISKEGCYKTASDEDEVSCFDCPYHIPSIYALTTLCESIMSDLEKYKIASRIKQFKLALSIDRKTVILQEAIDKYGEEYVFNCLGVERKLFEDALEVVPLPREFTDLVGLEG